MKTKYSVVFVIVSILLIAMVHSCSRVSDEPSSSLPYLHIDSPKSGALNSEECWVVCQAMTRMSISVAKGKMYSPIRSAEQINVSPELFQLLQQIIINTNNSDYVPGCGTRGAMDYPDTYSCVSYALAQWAGAPSFFELDEWIRDTYNLNGGVPYTKLTEVLYHFWDDQFSYTTNMNNLGGVEWSADRTVGVYPVEGGMWHMVNIIGVHSNGDFIIEDYSCDTIVQRNVFKNDMKCVIWNTWADTTAADIAPVDTLR